MNRRIVIGALCALAMGCGGGGDDGGNSTKEPAATGNPLTQPLPWIEANIFEKSCATIGCHRGSSGAAGLTLERGKSHGALVNKSSTLVAGKTLVVPGSADNSFLVAKIRGHLAEGEGTKMPNGKEPLAESDIAAIETWINAGAPAQ